jgi:catechol 2,3-dioxygenase-like lactoylglutathione lyase family enzyme
MPDGIFARSSQGERHPASAAAGAFLFGNRSQVHERALNTSAVHRSAYAETSYNICHGPRGEDASELVRVLVSKTEPERKEPAMVLSNYKVGAGFAVSDMARAREFYEGKLGLRVSIDSPNNVQYRCAEDSVLHIYLSPEHVGKSTETLASWGVDDIERVVDELTRKGVTFEQYDEPGLKTDEKGIATFEGDAKVAYFKDPDGHTLSIARAPRS